MSAKAETQREIQLAAHDIYESLVQGLLLSYKDKDNQGKVLDSYLFNVFRHILISFVLNCLILEKVDSRALLLDLYTNVFEDLL